MSLLPARHASLMIDEVDGETLVWDAARAQAVTLSALGGAVLASCDGETSVAQAAAVLGVSDDKVEAAVAELADAGLLLASGVSRRTVLKRTAIMGGVVLAAVVVPAASAAASPNGGGSTTPPLEPTPTPTGPLDGLGLPTGDPTLPPLTPPSLDPLR